MKQTIIYFIAFFPVIACNTPRKIAGRKENGTNYVLTVQRNKTNPNRTVVFADIKAVGSPSGERIAFLHAVSENQERKIIEPGKDGTFSFRLAPGKYYLVFFAVGFGNTETQAFNLRNGDSAMLNATMYPEVIPIDN